MEADRCYWPLVTSQVELSTCKTLHYLTPFSLMPWPHLRTVQHIQDFFQVILAIDICKLCLGFLRKGLCSLHRSLLRAHCVLASATAHGCAGQQHNSSGSYRRAAICLSARCVMRLRAG